ncbi:DNA primase [Streptococcus sp. sy018]|uniref:DNA primase n=1 Tax=Streptococcus sp. sy018 TaxID=2600147 RepID=UPI0021BDE00D|nr:DNA primase [Streptococcus sp. sy018]
MNKAMIEEVKSRVNIVEVIGEVVNLSRSGRHYLGNCPFHKEKTPSFSVLEDRQFYHCFGCGKSGDVFRFLEDYRQITFMESVQVLAERVGITTTVTAQTPKLRANPQQKFYDLHEEAVNFYHAILMTTKEGQAAKQYLYQRGLTDELLTYFKIGLSPEASDYLYQTVAEKYEEKIIFQSGLFQLTERNRVFDSFRNRIMFPLTNDKGQTIGFSGRIWQAEQAGEAKYKNTRATAIFNKSYELYHLDRAKAVAKKQDEIYVMEGFMDVIAAYRAGLVNSVASMGTALTAEHAKHLKSYAKKIILTYDGDQAGQEAVAKALPILEGFKVEIVHLPEQMDPDEFVQKNSPEDLAKLLTQNRISQMEFLIHHYLPDNIDNLQAQITYVERLARLLAKEQSITAQTTYIHKMVELLPDFNYEQVEQAVNQERWRYRKSQGKSTSNDIATFVELPKSRQLSPLIRAEMQLFHRLLHHDYLLQDFRYHEGYLFQTKEIQHLYDILLAEGELDRLRLEQLGQAEQDMYYYILEQELPVAPSEEELSQLEKRLHYYRQQKEVKKQEERIRQANRYGNQEQAILDLEAMIAQRRQMEKEDL